MPYEHLSPSTSCKSSESASSCHMQEQYTESQNPNLTKSTGEGSTRKRVYRACEVCRRKKVKCNGQKPCSHCIAFAEECYYVDTKDRSAYSRRYVESLELRLAKMEKSLSIACGHTKMCNCKADEQNLTSNKRTFVSANEPYLARTSYVQSPRLGNDIKYQRRSPIFNLISEAYQLLGDANYENEAALSFDVSLDSDMHHASDLQCSSVQIDEALSHLPPQDSLNQLIHVFYRRVYPVSPIVSEDELREALNRIMCPTFSTIDMDASNLAIVFSVLACAAKAMKLNPNTDYQQPLLPSQLPGGQPEHQYYARKTANCSFWDKAADTYYEQSRTLTAQSSSFGNSLRLIQVYLLQAVYLSSMGQQTRAWVIVGNAMRLSICLGMHTDIKMTHISSREEQARSRTWWSAYILDRLLGSCLGLPFGIEDREIGATVSPRNEPCSEDLLSGFAALVSLSRISGQVARAADVISPNDLQLDEDQTREQSTSARCLESALDAWTQSLPATFKIRQSTSDHPLTLQSCVTTCLLLSTRLQLFHAFQPNSRSCSNPTEGLRDHLTKCIQTAQQIVRFSESVTQVLPPGPWLYGYLNSLVLSGCFLALNAVRYDGVAGSQLMFEAQKALDALRFVEQILPGNHKHHQMLAALLQRLHRQAEPDQSAALPESQSHRDEHDRLQKRRRAATMCSGAFDSVDTVSSMDFFHRYGGSGSGSDCDTSQSSPVYPDSAALKVAASHLDFLQHDLSSDCQSHLPIRTNTDIADNTREFEELLAQAPSLFTQLPFPRASTEVKPSLLVEPAGLTSRGSFAAVDAANFGSQSGMGNLSSMFSDFIANTPLESVSR